jgi:RNA polymerase sigma-70 factor (ECF subfamily)
MARPEHPPWGVDHDPTPPSDRVGAAYIAVHADLLRYLRVIVGHDVAEDVASQVWVEMVDGAAGFRGDQAAFRRWVFATARRRALDHRRRWWQRAVKLCAPDDHELERATAGEEAQIGHDAAVRRIARLPKAQAEVVLLRILGGFSAEEVAAMTAKTPGAVRVIQHRALRRLADDLRHHPDGWPPA